VKPWGIPGYTGTLNKQAEGLPEKQKNSNKLFKDREFFIFKEILFKIMGQSLAQLYIHLIFGTKNRIKYILPAIENDLHSYIAGILKKIESPAIEINSVPDHIHILFRLSKNVSLAKAIEEVKKQSSSWVKTKPETKESFSWQGGYAAFSVSSSKLDVVRKYIKNQKEHHKKITFQQEVEEFMKKYDVIDFSDEFFWR